MNGESSRQIDRAIFDAVVAIDDPDARVAFLAKACGGDDAQLSRITGWLDAMGAAEEFFRSAAAARAEVGSDVAETVRWESNPGKRLDDEFSDEADRLNARIGRYQLLERIGEGGCGVVYLSGQIEPVQRKVALKIIRLGMDAEDIVARFNMERQALALMNHPNIAKVLDAGATESGRPYFVMELVHGSKITEHCDVQRLGLRQRLELFIQVCGAIQHAHQKGIIHRDIKPSNVLISTQEGSGVPKVIDFGIARAVEGWLSDNTATACDQFIGTPAYMSPEQAEGGQELDTRCDVYSLGVLLYELFTGRTPFDSKRLATVGMFELLRILREEEPPAPSTMLAGLEACDLAAVAEARDIAPAHLVSALRGDLDWIVIKALTKGREGRYVTVNDLALDLQRYLDDEPILARPPGRVYRLGKLVRRNKVIFAASVVLVIALITGIAVSSRFYFWERDARQVQARLRTIAEEASANEARLLEQSKARESVSLAAVLLAEGKTEEADAQLAKTPLSSIEPSMEAANVFQSLGDWNAIRQRWKQAADCYVLFLQTNRLNRSPSPPGGWLSELSVGASLVEAENYAGYDRFRADAISRYGTTQDPVNIAILLKACLLSPCNPALLDRLQPLKDEQAKILEGYPNAIIDAYQGAFIAMGIGLFEYRRGDFAGATDWCRKCLDFPNSNQARSTAAYAIAAMAAHRLGKLQVAHDELALALDRGAGPFASDADPRGAGQGLWQDWVIARLLLREAEELDSAKGGNPRR